MSEFEAQIQAGKLKHAVSVLRRVNAEAIFEITDDKLMCRVVDAANAIVAQVTLPRAAFDLYDVNDMRIGIDLDRVAGNVLKRAAAKDTISISGDENVWHVTRDIHQKSMGLLEPERLRKAPNIPVLPHAASMRFTGKEFKEIIAEASDISDRITIHASQAGLVINTISVDKKPDTYKCTLPSERFEMYQEDVSVSSHYTLAYLRNIAADMRATDDVLFLFSVDMPCEIDYARDGVVVCFTLAPRIDKD